MSDQELYALSGPGWRFPIYAKWIQSSLAEVRIADIPILKQQRKVVEEALARNCSHPKGGAWIYSRAGLEKIAARSESNDPEEVVMWRRPEEV